jgi:hypothetical protein
MSDPKTPAENASPAPDANAPKEEHHVAKVHHKDSGEIVSTAGGELIDGRIADITDGDR